MTAVTTSTSPSPRSHCKLQLIDTSTKARCDFRLYASTEARARGAFAFEGSVHEGHVYELLLLAKEEIDVARAFLVLNGNSSLRLEVKHLNVSYKDTAGIDCYCHQLILPKDKSRLFEMAYGFAVIELHLVLEDGSSLVLETDEIVCVCDKQDQEAAIASILSELTSDKPSVAIDWMLAPLQTRDDNSMALAEGNSVLDGSKGLHSYLQICKECISAYERNLSFFQAKPMSKLMRSTEIVGVSSVRCFGRDEIEWLAKSPEVFYEVEGRSPIKIHGKSFMPSRVRTSKTHRSYDTLEHRAILAFADELVKSLKAVQDELGRQMDDIRRMRSRLEAINAQGGILPAIIVIDACLKREEPFMEKLVLLQRKAQRISWAYKETLAGVEQRKYYLPRRTKVFQEVVPYAEIHAQMRKWDAFGSFEMLREGLVLRTWRMDKLYEYYVLYKLLEALHGVGFEPNGNVDSAFRRVKYTEPGNFYKNEEQVANVYELARGVEKLTLFYEPVVYGTDCAENGIDIHRATKVDGKHDSYWTPDYYLVHRCACETKRIILDAKFRRTGTVLNNVSNSDAMSCFEECALKYRLSTMTADCSSIDALWLLCGRAADSEFLPFQDSSWALAQSSFVPDGIATVAPKADESAKLLNALGLANPVKGSRKAGQPEYGIANLESTGDVQGEHGTVTEETKVPEATVPISLLEDANKAFRKEHSKDKKHDKNVKTAGAKTRSKRKSQKSTESKELSSELLGLINIVVGGTPEKKALYDAKAAQHEFKIDHPLLRDQQPAGRESKLYAKVENFIDGKDCYVFNNWRPNNRILLKRTAERILKQQANG